MPVCKTTSCRKRKDLDGNGFCPSCQATSTASDNCTCKQCNMSVEKEAKALECDKCSSWCHIECTNVPEQLYDLLVCNNLEDGLKWFCHDCRTVEHQQSHHQDTNQNQSQDTNQSQSVTNQSVTSKVCNKLKFGTCPHGVTGKTVFNGKVCEFDHPKICKRYTNNGPHGRFGCNGSGCKLFHPMLCNNSVRTRKCYKPNCKLYHLRWTDRGNSKPRREPADSVHYPSRAENVGVSYYSDNTGQYKNTRNSKTPNFKRGMPSGQNDSSWSLFNNQQLPTSQTIQPNDFLEHLLSRLRIEMDTRFSQLENMFFKTFQRPALVTEKDFPYLAQAGRSSQPTHHKW